MDDDYKKSIKIKLFITQFILPQPVETLIYLFVSLLVLLIASNQTILVILSEGAPVPETGVSEVFSQRINYFVEILQVPILGRVVLFLFWLAIGSIVYMAVWLFQNLAVEVYDDITIAKLRERGEKIETDQEQSGGDWWGTTLAHAIFVSSSIVVFLFFVLVTVNFLLPAWIQLFQGGLQTLGESTSFIKFGIAIVGTMTTTYVFVLFWKLFFRLRGYLYNSF